MPTTKANITLPPEALRRNGFISLVTYDTQGGKIARLAQQLAQQGHKIVLLKMIGPNRAVNPNLIELGTGNSMPGLTWDGAIDLVIQSMNRERQKYNKKLTTHFKVDGFQLIYPPLSLATTKIVKRMPVLRISPPPPDTNYHNSFDFFSCKPGSGELFERMPWCEGVITRWSKDKKVAWGMIEKPLDSKGQSLWHMLHITFRVSPFDCQPLSMLTKENVFSETVLEPLPVIQEPTVR